MDKLVAQLPPMPVYAAKAKMPEEPAMIGDVVFESDVDSDVCEDDHEEQTINEEEGLVFLCLSFFMGVVFTSIIFLLFWV